MRARAWPCLALVAACSPETSVRNLYPEISVAPASLDFGEVVVGEVSTQEIFVTNAGVGDLEVDLVLTGDGAFGILEATLRVEADPENPIGTSIPVTFTPTAFSPYQATLTLDSNDRQTPVLDVLLTGAGVDVPTPDIVVDPLEVDFGAVAEGSSATAVVLIRNEGNDVLEIGSIDQAGSGAFELVADPSNQAIEAGGDYPMVVAFRPSRDTGDSGTLTVWSNDPDQPSVEVSVLGNGGGGNPYPIARIDCPGTASPPETLTLDGSGSTEPGGGPLRFAWATTLAPPGSQTHLGQIDAPITDLWIDLGGSYEVQLVVTNEDGLASAPDRCFVEATPEDDLHVELTWDSPAADLDLHVLQDTSTELFDPRGDCHWCNRNPAWGAGGTGDDPRLDLDSRTTGPENVNILAPAEGIYPVRVHYWEGDGAVTARLTVYAYGEAVWTSAQVLERNQQWVAGQVNWPDGTFAVDDAAPKQVEDRGCR